MDEIVKLIAHYRKKAVGYRTAAGKKEGGDAQALLIRASIWEDIAEDLDAWLVTFVQEILEVAE
jgi:hypothetical protein